jgi:hypothetical protein
MSKEERKVLDPCEELDSVIGDSNRGQQKMGHEKRGLYTVYVLYVKKIKGYSFM